MYNDAPIISENQDKLNREKFSKSLAKSIIKISKSRNIIVIGLMGGWRTGKSSLLNLIEHKLHLMRI